VRQQVRKGDPFSWMPVRNTILVAYNHAHMDSHTCIGTEHVYAQVRDLLDRSVDSWGSISRLRFFVSFSTAADAGQNMNFASQIFTHGICSQNRAAVQLYSQIDR
jgi:hypothetical protein